MFVVMVGVKIKPLPKRPPPTSTEVDAMVQQVHSAVLAVLEVRQSSISFAEIYRLIGKLADNLTTAQALYESLLQVKPRIAAALAGIFELSDGDFPAALEGQWTNHSLARKNLVTFFSALEGFINSHHLQNINELVLVSYREFLDIEENRRRVQRFLLDKVRKGRLGEWVDRDVISQLCKMLVAIGINSKALYQTVFETAFLSETRTFYEQEALEAVTTSTWPEYITHALKRFDYETEQVTRCLDSSTYGQLKQVMLDCFVRGYFSQLTEAPAGVYKMLEEANVEHLKKTYVLLKDDDNAFNALRQSLYNYLVKTAETLLNDEEVDVPHKMQRLLSLHEQVRLILASSFQSSRKVEDTINSAFDRICNANSSLSHLLAIYVDIVMVREIRQMSDEGVENLISSIMAIFKFISAKDVFEAINKKLFAKRLLLKTSINSDAEKSLIRRLKLECGAPYTRKVEGMVTDVETAQQELLEAANDGTAVSLTVLKAVNWPTDTSSASRLTPELDMLRGQLNTRYTAKFPRRILEWKTCYGTAEVAAKLAGGVYDLTVSTYQMLILMLFNERETMTYDWLETELSAKFEKEFPRHVFGLIAAKVLVKSTATRVLEPDCELQVSPKFESKLRRIKVSVTAPKSKQKQQAPLAAPSEVVETRKFMTEACIVRIMKSRRSLEHNLLVAEVIKQLSHKFPPDPKEIKLRIESLITREYLAREESSRYVYVA